MILDIEQNITYLNNFRVQHETRWLKGSRAKKTVKALLKGSNQEKFFEFVYEKTSKDAYYEAICVPKKLYSNDFILKLRRKLKYKWFGEDESFYFFIYENIKPKIEFPTSEGYQLVLVSAYIRYLLVHRKISVCRGTILKAAHTGRLNYTYPEPVEGSEPDRERANYLLIRMDEKAKNYFPYKD